MSDDLKSPSRHVKPTRYVDMRGRLSNKPTQLIKCVFGLGRDPRPCVDIALTEYDLKLMAMDAPEIIPAGSTLRSEERFDEAMEVVVWVTPRTRYQPREGGPWK